MVKAATEPNEGMAKHASLHFDRNNPRSGDRIFTSEDEVLKFLIQNADVDELVTSIQSAGWVDFEPLIVQQKSNVVLEGNRRLAALRLLTDTATRNRLGYKIPNDGNAPKLPEEVRVRGSLIGARRARSLHSNTSTVHSNGMLSLKLSMLLYG